MADGGRCQIFQIVCVVRDLEETLNNWRAHVEFAQETVKLTSTEDAPIPCRYRGREIPLRIRQARFDLGGIDMKLVQPLEAGGDPYSDVLAERGQGFHHISICVPDREKLEQTVRAWGEEPLCEQTAHGVTYVTFDLRERMGLMFEPWDHMIGPLGPRDENGHSV